MNDLIFTARRYMQKLGHTDIRIDLFRELCKELDIKLCDTKLYFEFVSTRVIPKTNIWILEVKQ